MNIDVQPQLLLDRPQIYMSYSGNRPLGARPFLHFFCSAVCRASETNQPLPWQPPRHCRGLNHALIVVGHASQVLHGLACFYVFFFLGDDGFQSLWMFGTSVYATIVLLVTVRISAQYGQWSLLE